MAWCSEEAGPAEVRSITGGGEGGVASTSKISGWEKETKTKISVND